MTVAELIKQLQTLPQHLKVEINDNGGGECYDLEQVDFFEKDEFYNECVMLQVNC